LQQLRFVRALAVNLSCQSTADTSADVCGEVMSSDSRLLRFGRAAATYRQASVHQRDVGFDALFNIPKLLMQNLIIVVHKVTAFINRVQTKTHTHTRLTALFPGLCG